MSRSILDHHVLVMNKSWKPIGTLTVRDAIVLMSRDSAKGLCVKSFRAYTWEEWTTDTENPPEVRNFISSTSMKVPAPEVIILTKYNDVHMRAVRFTSRALYRRDDFTCQYCRKVFPEDELSVDHVVPRAAGGRTSWDNCVTACLDCNNRKADRSLKDAGLSLPKKPEKPKWNPIIHVRMDHRPASWRGLTQPEWWETKN